MINEKSKQLIDWSINQLEDEAFYNQLTQEIAQQLTSFYQQMERKKLLAMLQKKMEKAAIEYGEPEKNIEKLQSERQAEMLDLIGWSCVILWNLEKRGIEQ